MIYAVAGYSIETEGLGVSLKKFVQPRSTYECAEASRHSRPSPHYQMKR